jgi:hypothetical protein
MKKIIDPRFKINLDKSININMLANKVLFYMQILFCFAYALALINWSVFTILFSVLFTVHIFMILDVRRTKKIYLSAMEAFSHE